MNYTCPVCNTKMRSSGIRPGKYYCTDHYFGNKYHAIIYDDGIVSCYGYGGEDHNKFLFQVDSFDKLSVEYIEKMLLLK